MSRMTPMPATRLKTAERPTVNCLRVNRESIPPLVVGVASVGGVATAGEDAGLGTDAGAEAGVALAVGLGDSGFGGESTCGGVGRGAERGNAVLPGTSTAMDSVIRDLVLSVVSAAWQVALSLVRLSSPTNSAGLQSSQPKGDAQFRTAGAGIASRLGVGGFHRFFVHWLPDFRHTKRLFHSSIFQRVETNDACSPTGLHHLRQHRQKAIERTKFIIYRNPQRLKYPRGGVDVAGTRYTAPHQLRKFRSGSDRLLCPAFHNSLRNSSAISFFAIFPKHVRQRRFTQRVYQVCRGCPGGWVEPHVEWAIFAKTQSALALRKLIRTEPKIGEYAVHT